MKIAIIGAGMTGSLCAHQANAQGHQVVLFEKSRGRGGRCTHKRLSWGSVDMGAPVVPATDADFNHQMQLWCDQGLAQSWPAKPLTWDANGFKADRDVPQYVFVPAMNQVCKSLTQGIQLHTGVRVSHLQPLDSGWLLWDDDHNKYGVFDAVVCTAPWPQTHALLHDNAPGMFVGEQQWQACWALALAFDAPLSLPGPLVRAKHPVLQCLVNNSDKPGRDGDGNVWTLYFNHEFSQQHVDLDEGGLIRAGLEALTDICQQPVPSVLHHYRHLWRLARPLSTEQPPGILVSQQQRLIAAGDWSLGASVQSAWQAAKQVTSSLQSMAVETVP
ncbi:NAD(P)-binding protein [Aestuariibacter halophilus]|uniref:NAD(P)-binding protein n=1 Tax=Fluctibacter halophilus TaxID=226011 RepID=A0ABS8G6F8_9ALTE|nr:FAD-dependent oxidoreductase [Aestuariibacter halophilus]MCC2616120.1 NAD(P)-binding protein [Aestuariibacter halophilus]